MATRTASRSRAGSKNAARSRTGSARKTTRKSSTSSRSRSNGQARRKTAPASRSRARSSATRRKAAAPRRREKDIIALLKDDHREVEQMFRRYSRMGERAHKSKQTLVRKVVMELSKHAAVEEQILYPGLREMVAGGEKMMDEGVDEHQTVKELLVDLDRMSPGDEEFDPKMRSLIEAVRHHVREEESDMFPALRRSANRDRLVDMGRMVEVAKKVAPTRPHPHAPSKPPANMLVGAVAGVVDRVRDVGREVLNR